MTFHPAPFQAPLRAFATLVFAWDEDRVLVCDIADRGWCIPSGRVEPNETSLQAACREAQEEGGAELADCQYIGCYRIQNKSEIRWADCFAARIKSLGEIGMTQESRDRKLVPMDELASMYHLWNRLTEQVFEHSRDVLRRGDATRT